jgi:hypothetical protein
MKDRQLGENQKLSAIVMGCLCVSHPYRVPDEDESIAALHYTFED